MFPLVAVRARMERLRGGAGEVEGSDGAHWGGQHFPAMGYDVSQNAMRQLLATFEDAISAEIAFLERDAGEQSFELTSGQREAGSTTGLYLFLLTDVLRLPEDASGSLRANGSDIGAYVVSQEGNRIWLLLESAESLPDYIPSARLVVNETELLKRLKEKIGDLSASETFGLAPKAFGIEKAVVGRQSPPNLDERISGQTEDVLAQCIGSEVTFLWGPPGTGKTFTIAALAAALADLGESVLITSHTHAAVEQALWALIEPPGDVRRAGFLHGSELVRDGRILKVGVAKSDKIPPGVCLDTYLEQRQKERAETIEILDGEQGRIGERINVLTRQLRPWQELRKAEGKVSMAAEEVRRAQKAQNEAEQTRSSARDVVARCEDDLAHAKRSFLIGRGNRVQRASTALDVANTALTRALRAAGRAEAALIRAGSGLASTEPELEEAMQAIQSVPAEEFLVGEIVLARARREEIAAEVRALRETADEDAKQLVGGAACIFATLTKLYMDRGLINDLTWDTVIIDEASMAMPPLVAYAAARARRRVVLVGDMYQLPPVVRSGGDSEGSLLGTDIFESSGVTAAVDHGRPFDQLAKLMLQRRMHPKIAAVARALIEPYRDLADSEEVETRKRPDYLLALGSDSPLITIDTNFLKPWSGKITGSLSRFNFVSGQLSVELASLYASQIPEPQDGDPAKIGIVTPYAAQRRFLNKLLQSLKLERWVTAGTVHTFQGNECDVIIFDSVVGDPHWTARFTNPGAIKEVRRDLNVAVTRARHQFVFVGDKRWLRRHAKQGSAFGKLFEHLEANGVTVGAESLVGSGFRERVARAVSGSQGWDLGRSRRVALYTEKDFYPSFIADLKEAERRVVLYTPFIGKTRWPLIEPHVAALCERGVEVFLLHKPLDDPGWQGDLQFSQRVLESLGQHGVHLVPVSGIHAKTIVIDSSVVYEGSLNWASQVASYEHMWRFESKDMAFLIERMLQLEPIVTTFGGAVSNSQCPRCQGPLHVVNQRDKQTAQFGRIDTEPVKLACLTHEQSPDLCPKGYLRRVSARAPFLQPPVCRLGAKMHIKFTRSGKPWDWRCDHGACKPIRWASGDMLR